MMALTAESDWILYLGLILSALHAGADRRRVFAV